MHKKTLLLFIFPSFFHELKRGESVKTDIRMVIYTQQAQRLQKRVLSSDSPVLDASFFYI